MLHFELRANAEIIGYFEVVRREKGETDPEAIYTYDWSITEQRNGRLTTLGVGEVKHPYRDGPWELLRKILTENPLP